MLLHSLEARYGDIRCYGRRAGRPPATRSNDSLCHRGRHHSPGAPLNGQSTSVWGRPGHIPTTPDNHYTLVGGRRFARSMFDFRRRIRHERGGSRPASRSTSCCGSPCNRSHGIDNRRVAGAFRGNMFGPANPEFTSCWRNSLGRNPEVPVTIAYEPAPRDTTERWCSVGANHAAVHRPFRTSQKPLCL